MTADGTARPSTDEYDDYYHRYVQLVPDGELGAAMANQLASFSSFLESIPPERQDHAYAPGKWTVKEVLGHLIDTERVFMHRALCIARADPGALPGFDQNAWCPEGRFTDRPWRGLVGEWADVRRASMSMWEGIPDGCRQRTGTASGKSFTARALAYVPTGHVTYHRRLLEANYGLG